jgi:hypothetical protein
MPMAGLFLKLTWHRLSFTLMALGVLAAPATVAPRQPPAAPSSPVLPG